MAKKTNAVDAATASATTTKAPKVSLADKISSLKAQAESGDLVLQGAQGALDQLEANCQAAKVDFKSANKKLRQLVNALSK
jgi:predicted  nucleic acid-binding Zn-ribbon protein